MTAQPPALRPETETAIRAVTKAIAIADSREGADEVNSKGGIDIVTSTDVRCEDAIRAELEADFPGCAIVGEERGGSPVEQGAYWLVDPICGTRPYASNIPLYCANIALVEDGVVTAAAVAIGCTGEVLYAQQGSGAWLRSAAGDRPVQASDRGNSVWIGSHTERGANVARNAMLRRRWYIMQFPSSLGYAYLAAGRISGLIHLSPNLSAVHTAAGCFISAEAGALVRDLDSGEPWSLDSHNFLLAATPERYAELQELLAESS